MCAHFHVMKLILNLVIVVIIIGLKIFHSNHRMESVHCYLLLRMGMWM